MDFITALFVGVASFFGFGGGATPDVVEVQPTTEEIIVEEQMSEVADVAMIDDTAVVETESETNEVSISEVPESTPEPATDEVGDAMIGGAVSIDQITVAAAPPTQPPADLPANIQTILVAGGCFWCVEADLEKTTGVIEAVSGYAGGTTENPTYKTYGDGGHREVVEVTYDANQVSFEDLLIVTMKTTDPTDDDGTFNDRGDKYSSAFYYENAEQKTIIDNLIAEVDEFGPYEAPLAIDVEPRPVFWAAEDNHQDYYKGLLTQVKYNAYRIASGRTAFIERYWGVNDHSPALPWRTETQSTNPNETTYMWSNYVKPSKEVLKTQLDDLAYRVTQEDGTERRHTSPLDKNWDPGIYVDILSGEPLYSSSDKFDSGTGWPSFVKPITPDALTLHEDRKLFTVRTETRSAIADNHIGHVFSDGPADRGGMRYCMNGAALRFVPLADMEAEGYGDFIQYVQQ